MAFISLINSQICFTKDDGQIPAHKERRKIPIKFLIFQIMPPNVFCQLAEIFNKGWRHRESFSLKNIWNAIFLFYFLGEPPN
jgi:hypothetical protein